MSPLSKDPEKRARQLENLQPGAGAFEKGSAPALKHGLRSRDPSAEVIDPILDQVLADLSAKVPIRDEDGRVPAWLREMAWSAAIAKLQVIRCARFLAQHGATDERGRLRDENDGLRKANESYQRSLDRLAMTVGAHLKAGHDLQRTVVSAEEAKARRAATERLDAKWDAIKADALDGEAEEEGS